jgi:hypothetical protein
VVDRQGIPLTAPLSAANVNDVVLFEPMIQAIAPIKRPRGRPRKCPEELHADKAYDTTRCRQYLRHRGIGCRIARRGVESSERLGRHRWVGERIRAWLNRYRRLTIRYERRPEIHEVFLSLGYSLICGNFLQQAFC